MPNGVTFSPPQPPAPLTNVLTDTHIFVGDAANVPQDVALTLNATGGAFALANTGVLTMPNADSVTRGLLTAADWVTFNNKQNAIPDWTTGFGSGTQATSTWTATNAAANVNAAIVPKGNGAIVAAIPDGTAVGGNARGQYAVDLQMSRAANTQVASANNSGILSGANNSVVGSLSVIAGGTGNSISQGSQSYQFIGGGQNNEVRNGYGVVCGGFANRAGSGGGYTHGQSFVGGGQSNIVGTDYGSISGGLSNSVTGSYGIIGGGRSNTASGGYSSIGGGQTNTASGQQSFVGAGLNNTASGERSGVASGWACSASGSRSFVGGGESNNAGCVWGFVGGGTANSVGSSSVQKNAVVGGNANNANGYNSFIGGGDRNVMNLAYQSRVIGGGQQNYQDGGSYQFIGGGYQNRTTAELAFVSGGSQANANLYGQTAHASGQFSAQGDAQAHELIWRIAVTGTAITELFLDGSSVAAILPTTNSVWHGTIEIVAICTNAGGGTTIVGDVAAASYLTTIKRIGTNTALVGGVQQIGVTNADASMNTSTFTIDANNTNESLRIQFTAPATADATTQIRVVATFRGTQIKY